MTETRMSTIKVTLEEDEQHTDARAALELRDSEFVGWGRARRNPSDPNVPKVGEELAIARALSELSHQLVESAASLIESHEAQVSLDV
jgi:uncharacterized protein DUF1876